MPAPVDPGNFSAGTAAVAADVNLRFQRLYAALDKLQTGLDRNSIKDGEIITQLLAANAVTAAKIEAQSAWSTISISGTGITTMSVGYFKDSLGIVRMRRDLVPNTGGVPDGTVIGTLPAGFRPGTLQWFMGIRTGTAFTVSVSTAGVITVVSGLAAAGAGNIALSGIHFRAEN
jgi:hypothetical protein